MASDVLRSYIRNLISEGSPIAANYQSREDIRAQIQSQITSLIESGELKTQEDIESFLQDYKATVDMAVNALKMIPLAAYARGKKDLEARRTATKK